MTLSFSVFAKREQVWVAIAAVIAAFLLYGNSIHGAFVYDDQPTIALHDQLRSVTNIPHLFFEPFLFNQPRAGLYRPLTAVSYTVNYMFGESPVGFHILNILLHAANTFLVWFLCGRLFGTKCLAYAAAACFMVLAIHTEAVANIVGRAELLALFFSLLALFYGHAQRYGWSALWFLLAVLSKESAAASAPLLLWQAWAFHKNSIRDVFKKIWPVVFAGLLYIGLRYIALAGHLVSVDVGYAYNPLAFSSYITQLATALKVMLLLIAKTIVPFTLSADYSFNQIPLVISLFSPYVVGGILVLLGFVSMAIWSKTRATAIGWSAAMFLLSYFIVSNFIFVIGTIMAERIMYAPSLAIAVVMGWLFAKAYNGQRTTKIITAVIFAVFIVFQALILVNRNPVWASETVLFTAMAHTAPNSVQAQTLLAQNLFKRGEWAEGREAMQRAKAIYPDHLSLIFTETVIAVHDKKLKEAKDLYLKILSMSPTHTAARWNLGRLYFDEGQYELAAEQFRYLYDSLPKVKYATYYAASLQLANRSAEAIAFIIKYYGIEPANDALRAILGYSYNATGNTNEGMRLLKTVTNPAAALSREAGKDTTP